MFIKKVFFAATLAFISIGSNADLTFTLQDDGTGGVMISIEGSGVTGDRICTNPADCDNDIEMVDIGDYTDVNDTYYSLQSPVDFAPGLSIIALGIDDDSDFYPYLDDFYITLSSYPPPNTAYSVSGTTSLVGASFSSFLPGVYSAQTEYIETGTGFLIILSNETPAQEPEPEFALQWGTYGSAPSEFNTPHGVEADHSGNIYVTERGNHRIQQFDAEGNFIQSFGSFGSGPGQFILPNELAIDSLGDLYISDEGNCRIQKLSSDGSYILQWGTCGSAPGQFALNWGIAIDSNDQVFVADTFNYRVQVFNNDGNYLREWGVQGVGDGEFGGPRGIAVDAEDNVIVVDEGNHRIQKFENDGTYLTQWGSFGNANGEFTWPHAVATDIMGNVFIGDVGNPWVQKFDKDGNFLVRWGSWEEFSGEQPGLDVSPNGLIYVGDIHTSRIRVYGTKAEMVIEPGIGGEVKTTDGQLSITIPDDALSEGETISAVQRLPEEPLVDVQIGESGGSGEVFAAYDLEPDGLVFDNPVTLTITADVTALNQNQRDALDIYLFSDTNADGIPDTFVALGAVCYVSDGPMFISTCTAEILHFSMYGLIAPIDTDQDGVADLFDGIEDQCSNTAIPESVPTRRLGFNRWALVDADTVFDTKLAKNKASDNPYTLDDTVGCSCEQIIEALDLGLGHTKFGCSSSVMKEWVSSLSQ